MEHNVSSLLSNDSEKKSLHTILELFYKFEITFKIIFKKFK